MAEVSQLALRQPSCDNNLVGTLPIIRLTEQDYLATERAADFKSEFVGGEMYAMSGGSARHSRLAARVIGQLDSLLEGSSCTTF